MTIISDELERLFAQIERAWEDGRDRQLVFTLARDYPDYEEELHAFFEDLVLGPLEKEQRQIPYAETKTLHEWLTTEGFALAMRATPPASPTTSPIPSEGAPPLLPVANRSGSHDAASGRTWISFLQGQVSKPLPTLLEGCKDLTFQYLVLVSRQPDVVPLRAKTTLAKRIEVELGIPVHESLPYLERRPQVRLAASRKLPHEQPARNFEELLNLSDLPPAAKEYWLSLARHL